MENKGINGGFGASSGSTIIPTFCDIYKVDKNCINK
jgi:hypothetical protein